MESPDSSHVLRSAFLEQVDWSRPWLAPYLPVAQPLLQRGYWRGRFNDAIREAGIRNHADLPVRLVAQADLPPGQAYEAFISNTGQVPTRDNLHDFFNALMWLCFPKIKVRLNALQAGAILRSERHQVGNDKPGRGPLRDAATLFDENGALIISSNPDVFAALRERRWNDLFITERAGFGCEWEVWLFGHALMQKLVAPYKAITAHALPLSVHAGFFTLPGASRRSGLDGAVSGKLTANLGTQDFLPLPVLGVPGWWADQDAHFYEDNRVFRPRRGPKRES